MATFQSSSSSASQFHSNVGAAEEGRAALAMIARDFEVATNLPEVNIEVEASGGGWPQSQLGFFTHVPMESQPAEPAPVSTLCYIFYYTAISGERLDGSGRPSRKLYRKLVSSAELFQLLESGGELANQIQPDPLLDEPVAFNVVSFQAEAWSATPTVQNWQRGPITEPANPLELVTPTQLGPDWIEVQLVLTDERLAGRLMRPADWESGADFGLPDGIALAPGLHRYQTRIKVDMSQVVNGNR